MIKVNLYNIISSNQIFNRLLKQEFNGRQAFLISRLMKAIGEEIDSYNKIKEEMIRKYAKKNEDGTNVVVNGIIQVMEEHEEQFSKELNELMLTTFEINAEPIPFDWLEEVKITPSEAYVLEPFIKFE